MTRFLYSRREKKRALAYFPHSREQIEASGVVLAADQKPAIDEAIEFYKITDPEKHPRLVARPEH